MNQRISSPVPKLLCVEDDVELLRDVVDELTDAGYEMRGATTFAQAVEQVRDQTRDPIVCDVNLPDLSGYNLLKALRDGGPNLASIPLVSFTEYGGREALLQGKRAGADDYLVKPVDFDLLLATIEHRLNLLERVKKRPNYCGPMARGCVSGGSQPVDHRHRAS